MSRPIQRYVGQYWSLFAAIFVLLVWITLPYLVAAWGSNKDYVFGGFLLNPLDGNSYLAKMYEGFRGDWRFTLPYTAEKGRGAYLFLFYILLGHLGRELNLPLILVYHLARLFCAVVMIIALWRFWEDLFPERGIHQVAFVASVFGLGMGWLVVPFGVVTSDFWVSEAYPFLSAYTNPHFPLALALLLFILRLDQLTRGIGYGVSAALLALISPFGLVLALLVMGLLAVWDVAPRFASLARSGLARRAVWVFLGGAPILAYQVWAISSDPLLANWNRQNLTPSPPPWDLVISLSPWLWLSLPGGWWVVKKGSTSQRLLVAWLLISLILLYLPWGLQRRMMVGIYIPVVGLAAERLGSLLANPRRLWVATTGSLLLVLPTHLLILLAVVYGIRTHDPQLFLMRDEVASYTWIESNTPPEALIMASPQSGLFIPAYTGRRVIYGHPFETVDAESNKNLVEEFFSSGEERIARTLPGEVDYVFYGPREQRLGKGTNLEMFPVVYRNSQVVIYSVR